MLFKKKYPSFMKQRQLELLLVRNILDAPFLAYTIYCYYYYHLLMIIRDYWTGEDFWESVFKNDSRLEMDDVVPAVVFASST